MSETNGETQNITGQKRAWEPGGPPEGPPPAAEEAPPVEEAPPPPAVAEGAAEEGGAEAMATEQPEVPPVAPPPAAEPANGALSAEEQSLQAERAYLQHHNQQLHNQLAQLQQQHAQLTQQRIAAQHQHAAAAAQQQQHAQHYQQPQQAAAPARPAAAPHNPQWTEQTNESGQVYYWNSVTGESTWTRPADYNPPAAGASGPNMKGPPGANLFIVRKMRRGEYDEFNDSDLRAEFSKFGTVTRAEMTMDKETGWSKGSRPAPHTHQPLRLGLGMAHDEDLQPNNLPKRLLIA